jgi:hypothetical protein
VHAVFRALVELGGQSSRDRGGRQRETHGAERGNAE